MRRRLAPGRAVIVSVALGALMGCGASPHTRGAGAVTTLAVHAVSWNPTQASFGAIRAVAEVGDVVAVFGSGGASVLSSGAVVATDRSVTDWAGADAIRGADGASRWIVGLDGRGGLHYVRGRTSLADVSARYGLEGRPVRAMAMLDASRVGFLLDGELAVADRGRVTRYAARPWQALAGGAGLGAGVTDGALVVFDPESLTQRTYAVPGLTAAVIGPDGRIYAATARALYATTPADDLALIYDAERATLHGLAASGSRVWFADGAELGVVQDRGVAETNGAHLAPNATLAPSPSGDVWVLAAGSLQRFAPSMPDPTFAWSSTVAPIFARVCASCHQPNGVSGVDLSTAAAWEAERDSIRERVVVSKTMPPEGHPLSDSDRASIDAWAHRSL